VLCALCVSQGEGEDEDADDLVNQVLDEIGITTSSQVSSKGAAARPALLLIGCACQVDCGEPSIVVGWQLLYSGYRQGPWVQGLEQFLVWLTGSAVLRLFCVPCSWCRLLKCVWRKQLQPRSLWQLWQRQQGKGVLQGQALMKTCR
jgi:hypothetical protein